MMFPAKLPTMTAVVVSGRGERFERDLFAGQERWGLHNIFPALRDGELALRLWAPPDYPRTEDAMTREQKAADILKAHRAAAKVAKARKLSPAFDAECRAAEQPVGFSQWAGYIHGRLRHDGGYVKVLLLAGMIWFLVKIAAFMWMMVKFFAILIPIWLLGRCLVHGALPTRNIATGSIVAGGRNAFVISRKCV